MAETKTIAIWDTATGKAVSNLTFEEYRDNVGLAWDPGGEKLAAVVNGSILWDRATGNVICTLEES